MSGKESADFKFNKKFKKIFRYQKEAYKNKRKNIYS